MYDFYRPPWKWLAGLFSGPRLQAIKQRLNAPLGGMYVFVARKSGTGANMMRAEWRTVRPTPVVLGATEAARNRGCLHGRAAMQPDLSVEESN